jgi:hypothetical protein
VLSIGELLADTIMNVFADDSVSAIFGGENQSLLGSPLNHAAYRPVLHYAVANLRRSQPYTGSE